MDEVVLVSGNRGGFAGVDGRNFILLRVVVDNVSATADAGGLWLSQTQRELGCYQGICGSTALQEHRTGGLGGQGIGSGHRVALGGNRFHAGTVSGGNLRGDRNILTTVGAGGRATGFATGGEFTGLRGGGGRGRGI